MSSFTFLLLFWIKPGYAVQPSSIEEREHLQVYLRIRPFTSAERENGELQVKIKTGGKNP